MLSLILTSFIVITFSYLFKLIQDMEKKIENSKNKIDVVKQIQKLEKRVADYKYKIDEEVYEANLKCLDDLDDWAIEIFNKLLKKNEDGISIYVDEIPKNKIREEVDKLIEGEMEYIASKDDIEELKDEIDNMKKEFCTWNEIKEFATQDDIEELKVDIFNLINAGS